MQAGIEKKWLPYGATTLYGDYGHFEGIGDGVVAGGLTLSDSSADRWGLGIVQKFDSAALELYAQAFFYQFDGTLDDGEVAANGDFEDMSLFMIGSRIKF